MKKTITVISIITLAAVIVAQLFRLHDLEQRVSNSEQFEQSLKGAALQLSSEVKTLTDRVDALEKGGAK
jgi:hypothetical protein